MMELKNDHGQHHNNQWDLKIVCESLMVCTYLTVFSHNLFTNYKEKNTGFTMGKKTADTILTKHLPLSGMELVFLCITSEST